MKRQSSIFFSQIFSFFRSYWFWQFTLFVTLLVALFLPAALVKSDTLILGGSTSVFAMLDDLSALAREKNMPFVYNSMGSSAAPHAVKRKIFLIGFMSKKPPKNLSSAIDKQFLVNDRILVIYHLPPGCYETSKSKILDANKTVLKKIYENSNWQWKDVPGIECSGGSRAITRYTRENGSGTRSVFEKKLSLPDKYPFAGQMKSSGAVLKSVKQKPGSIAYISASYEQKLQSIDKIKIATNTDYLTRPFYALYLKGNEAKVKPFFHMLFTDQAIRNRVQKLGFAYGDEVGYSRWM